MVDRTPASNVHIALNLATAMVLAAPAPVLLLDGVLKVVVASRSFSKAFALDPASVIGRPIFELGVGEWDVPQLRALLGATSTGVAAIDSHEMDLERPGRMPRRLTLNAQRLNYGAGEQIRLLLTIVDVTDARLAETFKDDLIREKDVLLQEMQHRIANSLQIIASVILQTARSTSSDETRGHLRDAHHRVMSVATLQRQLTVRPRGLIDLHDYFTKLCESISASMVGDHDRLSIEATGDDSTVNAEISISLGLVVTELVINALKHAFPDGQAGTIQVDYRSEGLDWALSVQDNGVGMLAPAVGARIGLGTTIVEALSRQLNARVSVANAGPGTRVSVIHAERVAKPKVVLQPV